MKSSEYVQKLEDPKYLASREEIIQQCNNGLCHALNGYKRSAGKLEYELVTQELVEGLTNHLASYANQEKVVIVEVGAGNGKLAHHMQKSLQEKYGDKFNYHALDNGDSSRENKLPMVENIESSQGIEKHNPDIIICSRLPSHPYSVLPKGFMEIFDKLYHRSHKTAEETKQLQEMITALGTATGGNDATYFWRQNANIKEYILIGKTSSTGDREKTHGYNDEGHISGYEYDYYSREELEEMYADPNALFKQDGFTKTKLDIPTMNRMNAMFGFKDKKYDSEVFSFKRE